MFFTARQLEQMHRTSGCIVLPYRARLTPAARDWVRLKKVPIGYGDEAMAQSTVSCCDGPGPKSGSDRAADGATGLPLLWWCDGPCAAARAAIVDMGRETNLVPVDIAGDPKRIIEVVKHLASEVKAGRAAGGIIAVTAAAEALVYANRCSTLRAIAATSMAAVETGVRDVAANVLVIEHPRAMLMQVRNMLMRFVRGRRAPGEALLRRLRDLAD